MCESHGPVGKDENDGYALGKIFTELTKNRGTSVPVGEHTQKEDMRCHNYVYEILGSSQVGQNVQ